MSGLTNSSLVACYQDTCNILNSNSIKRKKQKYSINPFHETAKNLNNDVNDLWSLGYVRFEDEENSGYPHPQESREWKTVTTYSSKHKISTYIFISIILIGPPFRGVKLFQPLSGDVSNSTQNHI